MTENDHPFDQRRVAWLGEALPEPRVSFEFFPPRNVESEAKFWPMAARLAALRPCYVSVTCGASGNPADGTAPIVHRLHQVGQDVAAHLTCAAAPKAMIEQIAADYWASGIRRIVALRGDRPKDRAIDATGHHAHAADLVHALSRVADFEISVAGYPEAHPESPSMDLDLDHLKRKVDAGASRVISQYCFDTDAILRFRDAMVARGIEIPLAVGILPVLNFAQIRRFSEACGARIPGWLGDLYDGLDDEPDQRAAIGASIAAEQARRLLVEGIGELHFYTLNRAELTIATCRLLGRKPEMAQAA